MTFCVPILRVVGDDPREHPADRGPREDQGHLQGDQRAGGPRPEDGGRDQTTEHYKQ